MINDAYTTIRIWKSTLTLLRMLHAITGESMVALLDKVIRQELERVQAEEQRGERS